MPMTTVPYEGATTGLEARGELTRILRRFGCESVGFMDDFEKHEVLLAFTHRGRQVQLRASAKGWAAMYLAAHPWNNRRRSSEREHRDRALRQGLVAVNSILRDWIKGQVTAVECGILSFEAVFFPYMLTHDGRPVIERAQALLPEASDKVVPLPSPSVGAATVTAPEFPLRRRRQAGPRPAHSSHQVGAGELASGAYLQV